MHIYNWYHSNITVIHYVHEYVTVHYRAIPLLSAFPFPIPFYSPFVSLYLLGTLLAVVGSRPPRSQVARKLIFLFPSPYPYTPHSKIPTPRGLPDPNIHSLGRHREPGSQDPVQVQRSRYLTTRGWSSRIPLLKNILVSIPCLSCIPRGLPSSTMVAWLSHTSQSWT